MELLNTQNEVYTKFGHKVIIDPSIWHLADGKISLDIETDEYDGFVGLALYDGTDCFYFSKLSKKLSAYLENFSFIGHNIKFDCKFLTNQFGINIEPTQLAEDTAIMSYVIDPTKDSHGLKQLAQQYLKLEWPTYKQMVHPDSEHPSKKVTLDKQSIEKVAAYCGADAIATYKLWEYFNKKINENEARILYEIELPLMRILYEMEIKGVAVNIPYLQSLNKSFKEKLNNLYNHSIVLSGDLNFNVNSNTQLARYLRSKGHKLPQTSKGNDSTKKDILETINDPMVKIRLEYKKYHILQTTFIQGILNRENLGLIHTNYNQISVKNDEYKGISTTRLSSSDPNLQNIPVHNELGGLIREAFLPRNTDYLFICADYSQIEYRLLAHLTQEKRLIEAFKCGFDVHQETASLLGLSDRRDIGKTLNFAAIYGAQAKKISKTAKITEKEAHKFLETYWRELPHVTNWINQVKYKARQNRYIETLENHRIYLPLISSKNMYERMHWERAAVNYIIQGSAAEILKKAMIQLRSKGYLPILTVHDELVFEIPKQYISHLDIDGEIENIKYIMENIVKLSVPLTVEVGYGKNWREAKQ